MKDLTKLYGYGLPVAKDKDGYPVCVGDRVNIYREAFSFWSESKGRTVEVRKRNQNGFMILRPSVGAMFHDDHSWLPEKLKLSPQSKNPFIITKLPDIYQISDGEHTYWLVARIQRDAEQCFFNEQGTSIEEYPEFICNRLNPKKYKSMQYHDLNDFDSDDEEGISNGERDGSGFKVIGTFQDCIDNYTTDHIICMTNAE